MYDLAVIGAGINGAGIARDAAGRGLSVVLIEKGDLAGETSSASSKLIHGGLRYLEYGEFRLVREALQEREILLNIAPHLVRPMIFILPHAPSMRPKWMIRLGLWLYDHLAKRQKLPPSSSVIVDNTILKSEFHTGFSYADCWVDDARLVLANVQDAAAHGATIITYNGCEQTKRADDHWRLTLADGMEIICKAVVNATGVRASQFASSAGVKTGGTIRPVKGSHIVVPRLHPGEEAYILQQPDKRVVFVTPFEQHFSLIGTTDIACDADEMLFIAKEETQYLLGCVNRYFNREIDTSDVVWSFSGARALYDDGKENASANTRDYVLELNQDKAPMLSVLGGKITTYRTLAEAAMRKLEPIFPHLSGKEWTADALLPDLPLPKSGQTIAKGITEDMLQYAVDKEWVKFPQDFLWRRTKLGLHLDKVGLQAVEDWFNNR